MSEQIMETQQEPTDAPQTESQATAAKTYTQEEFDRHMAGLRKSIESKFERQLAELGDLNQLRELKTRAEKQQQEEALKRGEFERVLQEMAAKKDAEISKRDAVIREYKVDTPLLNAAAQYRSVNPEQVKALLKSNVTLADTGEVIVTGADGAPRYNDDGKPLSVDELVKEFLQSNPHFVQPTPATTNTRNAIAPAGGDDFDVTKLDMANPEHRKRYAEWRARNK